MYRKRPSRKAGVVKKLFGNPRGKWLIGLPVVAILTAVLLIRIGEFPSCPPSSQAGDDTGEGFWLQDHDVVLYLEALTRIKNHDAYLSTDPDRRALIRGTLKAFVEKTDPFAAYMTPEEFSQWKKSQGDQYVGIGMEIVKDPQGRIRCLPYAGSPAVQAGIQAGDQLQFIDGMSVQGRSVLAIGALSRGAAGTRLSLRVMKADGAQYLYSVERSTISTESVSQSRMDNVLVLGISAFTRDTPHKLKMSLAAVKQGEPLIIDLRDNAGGDLTAAVDSAGLFLKAHETIASVRTRQGINTYASGQTPVNTGSPLFIWQNEGTASAAEVFIAALTENRRARSVGRKSFGKGSRQEIFELGDGSALFLTSGFMLTPNGQTFDGGGLLPGRFLETSPPQAADYLRAVKALLGKKR
ncbi:MAG: S41 family peptidase [Gammaproteobacteria bacterium]